MSWKSTRWLVVGVAFACACSSDGSTGDAGSPDVFIAFASAFYGFHDWPISVPAMGPPEVGDAMTNTVHAGQPLVAYLNKAPPHGSTEFPIGTIIVKEVNAGDLTTRQIFAMVKRGGGFNSAGAVNWEWFELQNTDDPNLPVNILWSGFGPPSGESYGGNPATCNDCHEGAQANDYVWTQNLQLSSF
jgi:hypothetical protein